MDSIDLRAPLSVVSQATPIASTKKQTTLLVSKQVLNRCRILPSAGSLGEDEVTHLHLPYHGRFRCQFCAESHGCGFQFD